MKLYGDNKIIQILFLCICGITLLISSKRDIRKQYEIMQAMHITSVTEENIVVPKLKKEYRFLFISDTHLTLANEDDKEEVRDLAIERRPVFVNEHIKTSMDQFPYIIEKANQENYDAVLFGGDILDFPTDANISFLNEQMNKLQVPYLFTMGNHDFTYPWQYFTKTSYQQYRPQLNGYMNEDGVTFIEYEDLILLAVDNSTDQINENCLPKVKELLKKEKPMIIMLHVPIEPLDDNELSEETIKVWGSTKSGNSKVLLGENGTKPNKDSKKFLDMILAKDSKVVAVLAGHIHFYHKDYLNNNTLQIITDASYKGTVMEILVTGEHEKKEG